MKWMKRMTGLVLPAAVLAMGLTCQAAGAVKDGAIPSPARVESGVTYEGKEKVDDWSMLYSYRCEDAEEVFDSYRIRLDSMADFRATGQDKYEDGEKVYARVWYDYTGESEIAGIYEEDGAGEDVVLWVWVVGGDEVGLFTSMDITFMDGSPEIEDKAGEGSAAPMQPDAAGIAMQPGAGSALQPETEGSAAPAGTESAPPLETEAAPSEQSAAAAGSGSDDGPSGHWEYQTVQEDCPFCYGGSCKLCNGTGTYRMYGQEVPCDRNCSACDGRGYLDRTEYVFVAD